MAHFVLKDIGMAIVIGSETSRSAVLIADNEVPIQKLIVRVVQQLGLRALAVSDGASAIELVAAHHSGLCCVILGIDMPVMNGIDAAHSIQKLAPNLGIVLISGSLSRNYNPLNTNLRLSGTLHKPFFLQKMRAVIHHAIQGA